MRTFVIGIIWICVFYPKEILAQIEFNAVIVDTAFIIRHTSQLDHRKILKIEIKNLERTIGYFIPAMNLNYRWVNLFDEYTVSHYNELSYQMMEKALVCPDTIQPNLKKATIFYNLMYGWRFDAMISSINHPNQNEKLKHLHNRLAASYEGSSHFVSALITDSQYISIVNSIHEDFRLSDDFVGISHIISAGLLLPPLSSVTIIVFVDYLACFKSEEITLLLDFETDNFLQEELLGYQNLKKQIELTIKLK